MNQITYKPTCKFCGHSGYDIHKATERGETFFVCDSFVACVMRIKDEFVRQNMELKHDKI